MKDKSALDKDWSTESYFCESYRKFFDYAMPRFLQIAADISAGARGENGRGEGRGL
ncbi:MAG: hypothetical protein ACYTBJ_22285 [Planctomycetota bacterium]|jgi:hypothetical protein